MLSVTAAQIIMRLHDWWRFKKNFCRTFLLSSLINPLILRLSWAHNGVPLISTLKLAWLFFFPLTFLHSACFVLLSRISGKLHKLKNLLGFSLFLNSSMRWIFIFWLAFEVKSNVMNEGLFMYFKSVGI